MYRKFAELRSTLHARNAILPRVSKGHMNGNSISNLGRHTKVGDGKKYMIFFSFFPLGRPLHIISIYFITNMINYFFLKKIRKKTLRGSPSVPALISFQLL